MSVFSKRYPMEDEFSFDPAQYREPQLQVDLLTEALFSGDSVFVAAALKFILAVRGLNGHLLGVDPRLSLVMSSLDALGIDLVAIPRQPQR